MSGPNFRVIARFQNVRPAARIREALRYMTQLLAAVNVRWGGVQPDFDGETFESRCRVKGPGATAAELTFCLFWDEDDELSECDAIQLTLQGNAEALLLFEKVPIAWYPTNGLGQVLAAGGATALEIAVKNSIALQV